MIFSFIMTVLFGQDMLMGMNFDSCCKMIE